MQWVIAACLGVWLLSRVWFYLSMWLWVRSIKDPKERLEAEILWRTWRKGRR